MMWRLWEENNSDGLNSEKPSLVFFDKFSVFSILHEKLSRVIKMTLTVVINYLEMKIKSMKFFDSITQTSNMLIYFNFLSLRNSSVVSS